MLILSPQWKKEGKSTGLPPQHNTKSHMDAQITIHNAALCVTSAKQLHVWAWKGKPHYLCAVIFTFECLQQHVPCACNMSTEQYSLYYAADFQCSAHLLLFYGDIFQACVWNVLNVGVSYWKYVLISRACG